LEGHPPAIGLLTIQPGSEDGVKAAKHRALARLGLEVVLGARLSFIRQRAFSYSPTNFFVDPYIIWSSGSIRLFILMFSNLKTCSGIFINP
jgi:hypothetical protein